MNVELRNNLVGLLLETGRAHHAAFSATDGADPDWPIWYADYVKEPFAQRLNMNFHKSQVVIKRQHSKDRFGPDGSILDSVVTENLDFAHREIHLLVRLSVD